MNESVIYALWSTGRILCEWRDLNGSKQACILGGRIESCDRQQDDHVLAAVRREAEEELGIQIKQCDKVGDFLSNNAKFHVVLVEVWEGAVPDINRDNQNELRWAPLNTLIDSISLEPLKRIMEKLKNT